MQYFNPIYSIKEQSQMLFNMKNCTDLHIINIWMLERISNMQEAHLTLFSNQIVSSFPLVHISQCYAPVAPDIVPTIYCKTVYWQVLPNQSSA